MQFFFRKCTSFLWKIVVIKKGPSGSQKNWIVSFSFSAEKMKINDIRLRSFKTFYLSLL